MRHARATLSIEIVQLGPDRVRFLRGRNKHSTYADFSIVAISMRRRRGAEKHVSSAPLVRSMSAPSEIVVELTIWSGYAVDRLGPDRVRFLRGRNKHSTYADFSIRA